MTHACSPDRHDDPRLDKMLKKPRPTATKQNNQPFRLAHEYAPADAGPGGTGRAEPGQRRGYVAPDAQFRRRRANFPYDRLPKGCRPTGIVARRRDLVPSFAKQASRPTTTTTRLWHDRRLVPGGRGGLRSEDQQHHNNPETEEYSRSAGQRLSRPRGLLTSTRTASGSSITVANGKVWSATACPSWSKSRGRSKTLPDPTRRGAVGRSSDAPRDPHHPGCHVQRGQAPRASGGDGRPAGPLVTLKDLPAAVPFGRGTATFAANASRSATGCHGLWTLADDSGPWWSTPPSAGRRRSRPATPARRTIEANNAHAAGAVRRARQRRTARFAARWLCRRAFASCLRSRWRHDAASSARSGAAAALATTRSFFIPQTAAPLPSPRRKVTASVTAAKQSAGCILLRGLSGQIGPENGKWACDPDRWLVLCTVAVREDYG